VAARPPVGGSPENAELTARANALALAHQAGQPGALSELIELLRPLLRTALYRYRRGSLVLPAPLDLDDLYQQSWLILDGLARRWDPAGGDFPAYVRVTFLWELWRYVRRSRRPSGPGPCGWTTSRTRPCSTELTTTPASMGGAGTIT
jgi:hypothetical protein